MISASQTVYPCEEHGEVDVPLSALLKDGELDLYPEVASKGYFDIDYRRGSLVLKANRYVGFIPISDRVAIHVRPKAPISNLLRMVWRAGSPLRSIEGFIRGYQDKPGEIDSPEELYLSAFLAAMRGARKAGVLKRYLPQTTEERRGRLMLARTIASNYSKGYRHKQAFETFAFTVDVPENRILKHTLLRLLRHLNADPVGQNLELARQVKDLLAPFSTVEEMKVTPDMVARTAPALIRGLPQSHAAYEPALWLSYLIATKSGVLMERIGRSRFESVVIDVSNVFERYVRTLCAEAKDTRFAGLEVLDGNEEPVRLFTAGIPATTEPDVYLRRESDGTCAALADAKYKKDPTREDRYELLTFCEAAQVMRAAFICPYLPGQDLFSHYGTTARGVNIDVVRINLAAEDMHAEEERFVGELSRSLLATPEVV